MIRPPLDSATSWGSNPPSTGIWGDTLNPAHSSESNACPGQCWLVDCGYLPAPAFVCWWPPPFLLCSVRTFLPGLGLQKHRAYQTFLETSYGPEENPKEERRPCIVMAPPCRILRPVEWILVSVSAPFFPLQPQRPRVGFSESSASSPRAQGRGGTLPPQDDLIHCQKRKTESHLQGKPPTSGTLRGSRVPVSQAGKVHTIFLS